MSGDAQPQLGRAWRQPAAAYLGIWRSKPSGTCSRSRHSRSAWAGREWAWCTPAHHSLPRRPSLAYGRRLSMVHSRAGPSTHSLPKAPTWDRALLCTSKSDLPCLCTTANPDTTCYTLSNHGIRLNTCLSETGVREPRSAKPTRGKGHRSLCESDHSQTRDWRTMPSQGHIFLLTSQRGQGAIHLPRPRLPRPCQGSGLGSPPCTQE